MPTYCQQQRQQQQQQQQQQRLIWPTGNDAATDTGVSCTRAAACRALRGDASAAGKHRVVTSSRLEHSQ